MNENKRTERVVLKQFQNKKGITLIALVITVVILIILATVTLNVVLGEGGLIERAKEAKNYQINGEIEEGKFLEDAETTINDILEKNENDENKEPNLFDDPVEIEGEWREIYVGYDIAIARDMNGELWGWLPDEENNLLKDIEPVKLKDIDSTVTDDLIIQQDSSGIIYLIDEKASSNYYTLAFSTVYKVDMGQAIDIKKIEGNLILDIEGNLWTLEEEGKIVRIGESAGVQFDDLIEGVAKDKAGLFWMIETNGDTLNISEEMKKIGKEIKLIRNSGSLFILTTDGKMYFYNRYNSGGTIQAVNEDMIIKDLHRDLLIDEKGKLYEFDDIYGHIRLEIQSINEKADKLLGPEATVVDENGDLWKKSLENNSEVVKYLNIQKNWKEYATNDYAAMILDNNNKLLVYGGFFFEYN